MALQATVTLLGLAAGLAAAAAVLCALVVMWCALGLAGAFPAPAREPKSCPSGAAAPSSGTLRHCEAARPTGRDSGIDAAAFQAQIRRWCDPSAPAKAARPADRGPCTDAAAFQAQLRRRCAPELYAPCDGDGQGAGVPQSPEDRLGGAPAAAVPPPPRPGPEFEALQRSMELHCDTALEGMFSRAIDDQCAAVLKSLEDECRGSGALDDGMQGDYVEEIEEALSEQAAEVRAAEGCSMAIAGTVDEAFEEYHQTLMGELESMNQPMRCANLLELVVERIRRAGEFLLWII